jgi:hypothetical protein
MKGSVGLWQALAAMTALQALVIGGAVTMFDWQGEARRAQARVEEGAASMHHPELLPNHPYLQNMQSHEEESHEVLFPSKAQKWPHQHHGTHDMIIAGSV